ncbi:MAG: hypothetical protein ACWGMZ_12735 [Thermoguttaceae bacterium]
MKNIQFQTEVGADGVLNLRVPLGADEAKTPVVVTIEPLSAKSINNPSEQIEWHEFVKQTYGSCADLGLEEPEDMPLPPWNGNV